MPEVAPVTSATGLWGSRSIWILTDAPLPYGRKGCLYRLEFRLDGVLDRDKQLGVARELTALVAAAAGDPALPLSSARKRPAQPGDLQVGGTDPRPPIVSTAGLIR